MAKKEQLRRFLKALGLGPRPPLESRDVVPDEQLLPNEEEDPRPRMLFVCTGNFYRSRFAEAVFNFRAKALGLPVRAISAGLAINTSPEGLSVHAANGLSLMGIAHGFTDRRKRPFSVELAQAAMRVVALYDDEHRPMIEGTFPEVAEKVEYWDVPDLPDLAPTEALLRIRDCVDRLVREMHENPGLHYGEIAPEDPP